VRLSDEAAELVAQARLNPEAASRWVVRCRNQKRCWLVRCYELRGTRVYLARPLKTSQAAHYDAAVEPVRAWTDKPPPEPVLVACPHEGGWFTITATGVRA
jgi:hypothetical protein